MGLHRQINAQVPPNSGEISSRKNEFLPNNSKLEVEFVPDAKSVVIHLDASSIGEESETGNGCRHLMEHLIVLGNDGKLDERLESQGAFLTASTLRDGLDISVSCKPSDLALGISALAEITANLNWVDSDLIREKGIIDQEIALQNSADKLSGEAWQLAYGEAGANPIGDPDLLNKVTVSEVKLLAEKTFVGDRLAITIAGPIKISDAISAGEGFLKRFASQAGTNEARTKQKLPEIGSVDASGSVRAEPVSGISDESTAATLAAGLAIASTFSDSFFIYTPSDRGSLVVVGSQTTGEIDDAIDSSDASDVDRLFARGKLLAKEYVKHEDDHSNGFWRAYLLAQNANDTPEVMLSRIATLTIQDFRKGFNSFRKDHAVTVDGNS